MSRFGWIILLVMLLAGIKNVFADDLSYVTDDELSEELNARQLDLERATNRIKQTQQQLIGIDSEIDRLNRRLSRIDGRLIAKTALLYRLSRNGKTFQYLLTSDSAITFFKRIQALKKLVTSEMDKKRDANLKLISANENRKQLDQQLASTTGLIEELHTIVSELLQEQQNRTAQPQVAGL